MLDNLPVGVLAERAEGPVVAVDIGTGGGGATGERTAPEGGPRPLRVPGLGETLFRTMLIGSAGAVDRARAAGAYIISPPPLGVGLMEFHQMDRMVEAGRRSAPVLLEATGGVLTRPEQVDGSGVSVG